MMNKQLKFIDMKHFIFLWIIVLPPMLFVSCNDNNSEKEDVKPQQVVNYNITSTNGGAVIAYSLPNDKNILYVMAEYERNGKIWTERSSIYNHSLNIQGFNTIEEVTVRVYTVNYFETRSDPVFVSFTPLESPLSLAFKSLKVEAAFGGIFASWENPTQTELGVLVMIEEEGTLVEKEMYFSSFTETAHPFRQYEDIETVFALSFEDKFGNVSEIIRYTLIPLPEVHIEMPDNYSWQAGDIAHETLKDNIPHDNYTQNTTVNRTKVFNGLTHALGTPGMNEGWLTESRTDKSPIFTIDLGAKVVNSNKEPGKAYKLSRMKIWPRMQGNQNNNTAYHSGQPYTVNNVLAFELYGISEFPTDKLSDKGYWLEPFTEAYFEHPGVTISAPNFTDEWVYLGRFDIERLDLMGASAADIIQRALDGNEFNMPLDAKPVRYVRFVVLETDKGSPSPGAFFQLAELRFWGTDKITE